MSIDTPVKYETEAALCADFIAYARREGWNAYAETGGYDIVLVDADGNQIGVQAKLRFNIEVVAQLLSAWETEGPDYRAVLVPSARFDYRQIGARLGFETFYADTWHSGVFHPGLKDRHTMHYHWHYWNPEKRLKLPAYIPDVAAGVPAPRQLTEWKIKALKLQAVLELRGWVTRTTFAELGLDHRLWTGPSGWLVADKEILGRYKAGPEGLRFAAQHPAVYPQVLEDMRKWLQLPASL